MNNDIVQDLKKFEAYHQGEKDVIYENEHMDANYANVLITADIMVSGLFGDPLPLRSATDQMYVKHEPERLKKACLLQKYAQPYPMKGFKSPVLVLCSGRRNDCAVNLIKASSGLEPGAYGRCKLLSKQLVKFYESHYQGIKKILYSKRMKRKGNQNKHFDFLSYYLQPHLITTSSDITILPLPVW